MASSSELVVGNRRTTGGRRWGLRVGLGAAGLTVCLFIAYGIFVRWTRIDPPPVSQAIRRAAELPVVIRGPRAYIGDNWLGRERGIWEAHLSGRPYAMGYAQARLGSRLLDETESYMFDEMARYVPSKLALWLIRVGVRLRYRHLGDFVPPERQLEIAGLARGLLDLHSDFLPTYQRLVFYHALHEITQGLEHSPMLACTAFAASGKATTNGHLIIGRNFDFEGPPIFDRDKAVLFFRPEGKIPFASVAWVGMSGVVTGINAAQIFMSINAARTDDKGKTGMPVSILMRQVMEQARSIHDVVSMVKHTPVMVPDFYLVGDGKTGESVVIERSPTRLEVRPSTGHGDISLLTNFALSPAFASDAENDRLKRYLSAGARFDRLSELVHQYRGQIDPKKALEILRDKRGVGGQLLGLGNRNALDAIIATHSVIVDATSMTMWVSEGPHLLGKYIGFDLRKELGTGDTDASPPPDLPADPTADSEEYRDYLQSTAELAEARRLQHMGKPERALDEARWAESLEERACDPHRLVADLLRARGDTAGAKREYERFLALDPPHLKDVEAVKNILATL